MARRRTSHLTKAALYAWASPTTILGLSAGAITLATGGRAQRQRGAMEFHGGFAQWLLERTPIRAHAMTLGHVILGRNVACLDNCRSHELVHVRQCEAWGPFFLPAYGVASVYAWARGGHFYLDNWFEQDARRNANNSCPNT